MSVKAKSIIGSKVVTQSGQSLGRVVDFEVSVSGQNIIKYHVQGDLLGFLKGILIIDVNQVIEIKRNKLIVEDAVISEKIGSKKTAPDIEYAK